MDEVELTVRHRIPIGDGVWAGPSAIFSQWLPGVERPLVRTRGTSTTRLWIDASCVQSLSHIDDDYIRNWVNVRVSHVFVDVVLSDVDAELSRFIFDERESPWEVHHGLQSNDEGYKVLENAYLKLGIRVMEAALITFNRFIVFARNRKGQYWLDARPIDKDMMSSTNTEFHAQVRTVDYEWILWCPPGQDIIKLQLSGDARSITAADWGPAGDFVASDSRGALFQELLANAEALLADERRRSAVIEAVSALETTLSEFARRPAIDSLVPGIGASRIALSKVREQVDGLGLRGSLRFLVPLLFPDEVISQSLLEAVWIAVEERNNVIHNGQRDVPANRARMHIRAVRQFCEILDSYTVPGQPKL